MLTLDKQLPKKYTKKCTAESTSNLHRNLIYRLYRSQALVSIHRTPAIDEMHDLRSTGCVVHVSDSYIHQIINTTYETAADSQVHKTVTIRNQKVTLKTLISIVMTRSELKRTPTFTTPCDATYEISCQC